MNGLGVGRARLEEKPAVPPPARGGCGFRVHGTHCSEILTVLDDERLVSAHLGRGLGEVRVRAKLFVDSVGPVLVAAAVPHLALVVEQREET